MHVGGWIVCELAYVCICGVCELDECGGSVAWMHVCGHAYACISE